MTDVHKEKKTVSEGYKETTKPLKKSSAIQVWKKKLVSLKSLIIPLYNDVPSAVIM